MQTRSRWGALAVATLVALAGCGGGNDAPAAVDQVGAVPDGITDGEPPASSAEPTPTPSRTSTGSTPVQTPSSTPAMATFLEWPGAQIVEISKGFDYDIGGPKEPVLSADGSHVAFVALNDYGEGDPSQVVVRAVAGGPFEIVATTADGVRGDRGADEFSLSANGRTVAFSSTSTNLVPGDTSGRRHVYVKNLDTGKIVRASMAEDGTPADGDSSEPSLSADGRTVALTSVADNLDARDADGKADVVLSELGTGETTLVSQDERGRPLAAGGSGGVISGDGRTVVFVHGDGRSIEVRRLSSGEILSVDSPVDGKAVLPGNLTVSHNGKVFAFASSFALPGDTNKASDLLVADLGTGKLFRGSLRADGTEFENGSKSGAISPDGSRVVFNAFFLERDADPMIGALIRTLADGTTTRVRTSNRYADSPTISTANDRVAFMSGSELFVVSR